MDKDKKTAYAKVFKDVTFSIEVLPCVINGIELDSGAFSEPWKFTILRDTRLQKNFATRLFSYRYDCNYPDSYTWELSQALTED